MTLERQFQDEQRYKVISKVATETSEDPIFYRWSVFQGAILQNEFR